MLRILLLLLLAATPAYSTEYYLVRNLNFEVGKYTGLAYTSYPLLPEYTADGSIREELTYSTDIVFNVDLIRYYNTALFFDNKVEGLATNKQYRYVSWEFELGLHLKVIDFFLDHKSEHVLDQYPVRQDHFPVSDRIMVRFLFIDRPRD
jgi:hypothetical protein